MEILARKVPIDGTRYHWVMCRDHCDWCSKAEVVSGEIVLRPWCLVTGTPQAETGWRGLYGDEVCGRKLTSKVGAKCLLA